MLRLLNNAADKVMWYVVMSYVAVMSNAVIEVMSTLRVML